MRNVIGASLVVAAALITTGTVCAGNALNRNTQLADATNIRRPLIQVADATNIRRPLIQVADATNIRRPLIVADARA